MIALPTIKDIHLAATRIAGKAHKTPVLTCSVINDLLGMELFFKCENFQKVGAFKFRGACNAVTALSEEDAQYGVATHSSGNHAQALALAAKTRGIPAYIVMPETSPKIKQKAVAGYGGQITFCRPTLQAREETLKAVVEKTGATFIHPFNNFHVMAGQGTCALEFLEEVPDLEAIIAPVGGGGLLSGTAITAKHFRADIKVFAAEPQNADDAWQSFRAGHIIPSNNPKTIADGLLTSIGEMTWAVMQEKVDDVALASEENIIKAMRLIWERMKIIIEPSCAVPLAMLLENDLGLSGQKVGIILTGGNVDLDRLPWQ